MVVAAWEGLQAKVEFLGCLGRGGTSHCVLPCPVSGALVAHGMESRTLEQYPRALWLCSF